MSRVIVALILFVLALSAVIILAAAGIFRFAPPSHLPNVILISIDTLRADHLGCYGYARDTSPNIDALARESLVFEKTYSQAGYTLPSYMALFTSQYPNENRVKKGKEGFRIFEDRTTLTEYLKGAGYATCGMIDGGWLRGKFGFNQGFDEYIDSVWNPRNSLLDGDNLEEAVFPWLEDYRSTPFFLFLYTIRYVHGPFEPPPPYDKVFLNDSLYRVGRNLPVSEHKAKEFSKIPGYQKVHDSTSIDFYIAMYDGEIKYMDSRIGALIGKLKDLKIFDNTIFIFTADHGESLDEHEWYLDHGVVYDNVVRVPLIIRYPSLFKEGKRIEGNAHLIDILPTLADILEIPVKKEEIRGKSLLPLIHHGTEINPVTFSGHGNMNPFSIRDGKWKMIFQIPQQSPKWSWQSMPGLKTKHKKKPYIQLFNLEEDPEENRNLLADPAHRRIAVKLFRKLRNSIDFSKRYTFRGKVTDPLLDEKTKKQLDKLGYFVE